MSEANIIRAVKEVHQRFLRTGEVSGSHSDVAFYNAILHLIPTGITSAAIGSLDLKNLSAFSMLLTNFIETNEDEKRSATLDKLARHIQWGETV
jgi:hypothetical protein